MDSSVWPDPQAAKKSAKRLLAYYDREGRTLPWRGESDLYRIWVSEIMLQQTGVVTVIPYYERFIQRFKNPQELAQADLSQVLHLWQGLGYYQRARNLHKAAIQICREYQGVLPEKIEQWQALPGIGPSTAAAILAIGRDQPHAILDGNVKRVLSRRMALSEPVESTASKKILWKMATLLTPSHRPGDYAQAIMDLGATLCSRSKPNCFPCPWQRECLAHEQGQEQNYPVKKTTGKKAKPHLYQLSTLLIKPDGSQLLGKRPEKGLLGGLWEPLSSHPASDYLKAPSKKKLSALLIEWGITAEKIQYLGAVNHTFTHFHLTAYTYQARYQRGNPTQWSRENYGWMPSEEIHQLPRSTLHKKIMALAS
jgi:A/G-specific adenine glycosylase